MNQITITRLKSWIMIGLCLIWLGPKNASATSGETVRLDVALGTPLMLAGQQQTTFLKIGLTGNPLRIATDRARVNVAIVLDRSGSMSGQKLYQAKRAAIMAVNRLGKDDIVSLVTYNHTVTVLIPATKVGDGSALRNKIQQLFADGNTALFAGVAQGATEVRKFLDRNHINRIVLLSDGLANVGPSSPDALGQLGWSLSKEGISVTTVGLGMGYNEDLMVQLAQLSDGNHAFAENATDLARIFTREFGDLLSVVAREVIVEIRCPASIRPVRVLGRQAEINGNVVIARLNQLYADQEKFILLEVAVPPTPDGMRQEIATVNVQYADIVSKSSQRLGGQAIAAFTHSSAKVEQQKNRAVLIAGVDLIANETNKAAVELRDRGQISEAQLLLDSNALYLEKNAIRLQSDHLKRRATTNRADRSNMNEGNWKKQRKKMRKEQFSADQQMIW